MSSSKMKNTICDRYYFWQWVLNLTPRKLNIPLWFGSVMHAAFEVMPLASGRRNIYKIMDAESKKIISEHALVSDDAPEIKLQLNIAKTLIKVYLEECKQDLNYLSDTHTETPFAFRLKETSVMYEGTVDAYGKHHKKLAMVERKTARTINDDFFAYLQEEIAREIRLMEFAETESHAIAQHLERLYEELHPSDNLRTIPGVGQHTAPIFLAAVVDPSRFRSQSAFANYTGVVPVARQSSNTEARGLRMTKAGPAIMKWAPYQTS